MNAKRLAIPAVIIFLIAVILYTRAPETEKVAKEPAPADTTNVESMQAKLDDMKAAFEKQAPPDMVAALSEGVRDVAASGVLQTALKVGDKAPDFELPDAVGKKVRLSNLLADGPVILTWYRGVW